MQMVTGGGEDLDGLLGQGVAEFDAVDVQGAVAEIGDGDALADQAGIGQFAGPVQGDLLVGVLRVDADHGSVLVISCVGADGGDGEIAEQFTAISADIDALRADPRFGLRGQDARPCGVVQCTGHALRFERVIQVHEGFRVRQGPPPMDEPGEGMAGENQRERHVCRGVLRVYRGQIGAVIRCSGDDSDARHCTPLVREVLSFLRCAGSARFLLPHTVPTSLVVWYVFPFSLSRDACRVHCARKTGVSGKC